MLVLAMRSFEMDEAGLGIQRPIGSGSMVTVALLREPVSHAF